MTDPAIRTTAVWNFILRFKERYDGSMPTVREIAEAVGLRSSSSAHHQLRKLETFGCIERRGRRWCVVGATWTRPPSHWRRKQ